jgi:peptidoglycan/xylan/chitin deacetylase (PgdA/CDA1 family)
VIGRLPTTEREVALTFDDGPNAQATPVILDVLRDYGVRATFFVLGAHVRRWPGLVRRMRDEGHVIGNHGYFHRKLHFKGPRFVRGDLECGARAIQRATGAPPRFYRAPHGFRSPWVTPIASSLGERTIGWTAGVWDTDRPGAAEIARRTLAACAPGAILLLHDGDGYDPFGDRMQTAEALTAIIEGARAQGYRFVTLPGAE